MLEFRVSRATTNVVATANWFWQILARKTPNEFLMLSNALNALQSCAGASRMERGLRAVLLFFAFGLALPTHFYHPQGDIGLDVSWGLALHIASIDHKSFGQDFVFTYGPLGYLFIRTLVNKWSLLAFDAFIFISLFHIYWKLLPRPFKFIDAFLLIGIAGVTRASMSSNGTAAVVFAILCYWLCGCFKPQGTLLPVTASLLTALVLFFGKLNYGLLTLILLPVLGLCIGFSRKGRLIPALALSVGFPLLLVAAGWILAVDLNNYIRAGYELIKGYNEAMCTPPVWSLVSLQIAVVLIAGVIFVMIARLRRLPPVLGMQTMILLLVAIGCFLFFKNAFVRADESHTPSFHQSLPLLLAVWHLSSPTNRSIHTLMLVSLVYPLAGMLAQTEHLGRQRISRDVLPLRYLREAFGAPRQDTLREVSRRLQSRHPAARLPKNILHEIGDNSAVDVMPWEASIAVVNGLGFRHRPVPQSYSVYTPWLDNLNASWLASAEAPRNILFAAAQISAIDGRLAIWDESITNRVLLANYQLSGECEILLRVWPQEKLEPATVFLLNRLSGARRFKTIATTALELALDQPIQLQKTRNLLLLRLDINRTTLGALKSNALFPDLLMVRVQYIDGSSKEYRAVPAILETGVLVNWRVEGVDEIRNWLMGKLDQNLSVVSVCFTSASRWAWRPVFRGALEEVQVIEAAR